jgi:hypothetical protein
MPKPKSKSEPTPKSTSGSSELEELPLLEQLRIATMPEAARLSGASEDHLRRHHSDKIIILGPRRQGMRVMHALMLRAKVRAKQPV